MQNDESADHPYAKYIYFNIIQLSQYFLEPLVSPLESAQYVTYVA